MYKEQVLTTQIDNKTVTVEWWHDGHLFKGKADCSPEDEFDFTVGGNIALERAAEKINEYNAKKNFINGKYVWIGESEAGLTRGKIYNIIDGFFIDDDGDERPDTGRALTKENFENDWFGKYFIAIVK